MKLIRQRWRCSTSSISLFTRRRDKSQWKETWRSGGRLSKCDRSLLVWRWSKISRGELQRSRERSMFTTSAISSSILDLDNEQSDALRTSNFLWHFFRDILESSDENLEECQHEWVCLEGQHRCQTGHCIEQK